MDDWFNAIASGSELPGDAAEKLRNVGFVVIQGPVAPAKLARFAAAYDAAVSEADPIDVSIGSTTTRVNDFVNRGADFDGLYVYAPILAACCSTIGRPFKLSTIVYNGSVWHGHSANRTREPRRSIQGAYIRRDAEPAVNQAARIRRETLRRIDPLAKYLLAV